MRSKLFIVGIIGLIAGFVRMPDQPAQWEREWPYYGGNLSGNHYSVLDQITKDNVNRLEVAWSYDMDAGTSSDKIKCNPLIIDGTLYGTTNTKNVVALDAKTGQEKWVFSPRQFDPKGSQGPARGLTYWEKGNDKRLFYVFATWLYAINANNGQLIDSFGKNGRIPYSKGLIFNTDKTVSQTTPGIIYGDLLISGSFVSEYLPAAPGDIRAINVLTGAVEWVFHTIPHPGEFGYETWPPDAYKHLGGVNNWAGMSLDQKRGIAYIPLASPTYDFYGANRKGQNLFGNSLVALNAKTGKRIWHYQITHHDLWDRDLPCPPNLITVTHHGPDGSSRQIDAVAQPTKSGYVYLFDRETGKPLFEIKEVPVPPSTIDGETAWPTQPIPVKPAPFARQEFREEDITTLSNEANAYVKAEYKKYITRPFSPPSVQGTVVMPFFNGGASWGGAAYDQQSGLLFINANDMPWLLKLIDLEKAVAGTALDGAALYKTYCASCHGENKEGGHYVPDLKNVAKKYAFIEASGIVKKGKGMMPAMSQLSDEQTLAVVSYIMNMKNVPTKKASTKPAKEVVDDEADRYKLRYTNQGYTRFNDKEGYPAIKPPWGTLSAIDLNKGEIVWQSVLGEYPELTKRGIPPTGARNEGGPIVTKSGLIFIAATNDDKIRAFDKSTGAKVWEYTLPGSGSATPATYEADGKQYIVIAVSAKVENGYRAKYLAFRLRD
jgi:quinoprotein glucose dehydrogenase